MDREKEFAKLYTMLDLMGKYSFDKPGQIEKVCKERNISNKYFHFTTLVVESFFSVYSFYLLVKEALFSNASGVLRTLIEQITAVYVLANNENALERYLEIKDLAAKYENKEISIKDINEKYNLKITERNIELFFDYGWSSSFGSTIWGRDKIIKESGLEEVLEDFWYLNKFAHGQMSWYQLLRVNSKDVLDHHIARTIMICGKLFNYLCSATVKYFGKNVESDESYVMFAKIKTLYLNINTYAIRRIVLEKFKSKEDIRLFMEQYIKSTKSSLSMLVNHEFDDTTKNLLAITCYRQMETVLVMFAYTYSNNEKYKFDTINLYELLNKNIYPLYKDIYLFSGAKISFDSYKELISKIDDHWAPFKNDTFVSNIDSEVYTITTKLFMMTDLDSYNDDPTDEGKELFANLLRAYFKNDIESLDKIKYTYLFYGTNLLSVIFNYIFLTHSLNIDFDFGNYKLEKGTKLYRIRKYEDGINYNEQKQWSYNPKMAENRVNVQGEPMLYLGTTENICLFETHITNGEKYVLGEYEVTEDILLGGFLDCEYKTSNNSFFAGVILNAFLIAPSRNDKNDKLFKYLDEYYKAVQLDDLQIKNAKDVDLPFKFATINKKEEYYKLTNRLLKPIKNKYPDGIIYSSCYLPVSTIWIECSDMNVALSNKGMNKLKFLKAEIKNNNRTFDGVDIVKMLIKTKDNKNSK